MSSTILKPIRQQRIPTIQSERTFVKTCKVVTQMALRRYQSKSDLPVRESVYNSRWTVLCETHASRLSFTKKIKEESILKLMNGVLYNS